VFQRHTNKTSTHIGDSVLESHSLRASTFAICILSVTQSFLGDMLEKISHTIPLSLNAIFFSLTRK